MAVVTAPDTQKFFGQATNSTLGQLWRSPEMKPFREKFIEKFKAGFGDSLEKDLGVKLDDFSGLAQGQATVALLVNNDPDKPSDHFAPVLLLDTKDHADQLKKNLASIKKKWADANKP